MKLVVHMSTLRSEMMSRRETPHIFDNVFRFCRYQFNSHVAQISRRVFSETPRIIRLTALHAEELTPFRSMRKWILSDSAKEMLSTAYCNPLAPQFNAVIIRDAVGQVDRGSIVCAMNDRT